MPLLFHTSEGPKTWAELIRLMAEDLEALRELHKAVQAAHIQASNIQAPKPTTIEQDIAEFDRLATAVRAGFAAAWSEALPCANLGGKGGDSGATG